jgi:hypothetical protein
MIVLQRARQGLLEQRVNSGRVKKGKSLLPDRRLCGMQESQRPYRPLGGRNSNLKANLVDGKLPVVVVLGVHRSGTSLTANFMNAAGVDFGQDLPPADKWNAAGYWESQTIREIHDEILKELNCNWHNPPLSFPAEWWRKPRIQELKKGLAEFVGSQCKRKDKIYGFKDPRTALLLPLWLEIFDELQLEPLYVLTVRHPGPVAASLASRDGLGLAHSQALWFKTNLDVVSHAGNKLRAIVDYDCWFDSGMEQARTVVKSLDLAQAISEEQIVSAVNQTIHSGLRHHSSGQDEKLSPVVARFYSLLRQAATDGKVPDELWTLTENFERTKDLWVIWDGLVAERDAVVEATTTRLKKQKELYTYVIISILVVFSLISSFLLFGAHKWFE